MSGQVPSNSEVPQRYKELVWACWSVRDNSYHNEDAEAGHWEVDETSWEWFLRALAAAEQGVADGVQDVVEWECE